jgi:hypothetical protein
LTKSEFRFKEKNFLESSGESWRIGMIKLDKEKVMCNNVSYLNCNLQVEDETQAISTSP